MPLSTEQVATLVDLQTLLAEGLPLPDGWPPTWGENGTSAQSMNAFRAEQIGKLALPSRADIEASDLPDGAVDLFDRLYERLPRFNDSAARNAMRKTIAELLAAVEGTAPADEALNDHEQEALEYLRQQSPALVLKADMAARVGAPNTVAGTLELLVRKQLVHQPQGPRKGWALTKLGMEAAIRLRTPR